MELLDRCPICQADARQAAAVYPRRDDALYRCPRCRSLFANPRRTPGELQEQYGREYYAQGEPTAKEGAAVQMSAQVLHRTILRLLRRRYPRVVRPGCRLLDFGCGLGYFLAEAKAAGLEGVGIELSPVAARQARETLGLDVRAGDESALADLAAERFDLVTAWEVIEHSLQPRQTLAGLIGRLSPGGVLGLSLPNLRCWRYRLEGGRWFNVQNPTHLNFFSWPALRSLLEESGLVDVRRVVFWGGRPGFGPAANLAQYLVRLLHLGSDVRVLARKPT